MTNKALKYLAHLGLRDWSAGPLQHEYHSVKREDVGNVGEEKRPEIGLDLIKLWMILLTCSPLTLYIKILASNEFLFVLATRF